MEIIKKYPPKEEKKIGRKPKFIIEYMNMVAEKVVEDIVNINSLVSSAR